jgi:cutinase
VTSFLGPIRVGRWGRRYFVLAAVSVVAAAGLVMGPAAAPSRLAGAVPAASAAACPEVEVVFARGREEPPGTGILGTALVSALRSKVRKNIGFYAVNYDADTQVDQGANDMSQHIQYMAHNCPDTRLVLGGYSLGAAVTDVVLAVPSSFFGFDNPLPVGSDAHIAAVALFGNGTQRVLGPVSAFSPLYGDKTIELCNSDDPICSNVDPNNWNSDWPNHLANAYIKSGMINQAADFVAGKL